MTKVFACSVDRTWGPQQNHLAQLDRMPPISTSHLHTTYWFLAIENQADVLSVMCFPILISMYMTTFLPSAVRSQCSYGKTSNFMQSPQKIPK